MHLSYRWGIRRSLAFRAYFNQMADKDGPMGANDTDVISADGTRLSARISGEGTPLVLVHGTGDSQDTWGRLPALLAEHHTVWTYDRRGRGRSGDSASYSLGREIEDVQAVVAAAGAAPHLLGHSFGGVCALEAAQASLPLRSLIVFEPPVHAYKAKAAADRSAAKLEAGEREEALEIFITDLAGVSEEELAAFRAIPSAWQPLVEMAHTVCREIQALSRHPWEPSRFASVDVPTLQLSAELTEGPVYPSHDDIRDGLPHATHATLPNQGHMAFLEDSKGFAEVVLAFTLKNESVTDHAGFPGS